MDAPDITEQKTPLLIVDDDEEIHHLIQAKLGNEEFVYGEALDGEKALELLREEEYRVVILDQILPGQNGTEILKRILEESPHSVVIMLTGFGSIEGAVEAVRIGAFDYITKPITDWIKFHQAVRNAVESWRMKRQLANLGNLLNGRYGYDNIIGAKGALRDILDTTRKLSMSTVPVLILGETGTGKELIARAIHFNSRRRDQPFVTLNCSAIPESLLESEMFGHEKGAFTGATNRKIGRFERANGGTLFLDEIGDMKPELQAKLLRVLQEQEIERVGGTASIKVDVRILSATHRDLQVMCGDGSFREDLYYRLSVYPISLPPLRSRREDIPELAAHFLSEASREEGKKFASISADAVKLLQAYSWPGNVRQLENVMRRIAVDLNQPDVTVDALPQFIRDSSGAMRIDKDDLLRTPEDPQQHGESDLGESLLPRSVAEIRTFDEYEREILVRVLTLSGGDTTEAANRLQISRSTIYRKLDRYGLDINQYK